MRLREYLNEEYSLDEIVRLLKKDCSEYISDVQKYYSDRFIYSGRKSDVTFEKKRVRKNRQPRDTPKEIHEAMDNWFYHEFGIRFRSNAMFGSFDSGTVRVYGNIFIVFPIGKYKAISSSKIPDVYEKIMSFAEKEGYVDELSTDWRFLSDNKKSDIIKYVEELLERGKYKDIKEGFNWLSEIMLHCDEYYILNKKKIGMPELWSRIGN